MGYLRAKRTYLSEESKTAAENPLRVLDSKEPEDLPIIEEAPQILDWLSDASKNYFMKVLEYLDALEIPYMLEPTLVRGLDYYTDTVFELFEEGTLEKAQSALGGGGRYDRLIEQVGGRATPACGFAIGLERVVSALRRHAEAAGKSDVEPARQVFFAQLGEQARRRALYLVEISAGRASWSRTPSEALTKAQLELANRYRAPLSSSGKEQDGTMLSVIWVRSGNY